MLGGILVVDVVLSAELLVVEVVVIAIAIPVGEEVVLVEKSSSTLFNKAAKGER